MSRPDLEDPLLGRMRFDESLDWYEGVFEDNGLTVPFNLHLDGEGRATPALIRARTVLADWTRHEEGARGYAVSNLLKLKNVHWLGEDEDPVTPEEFASRMQFEGVEFSPEGEVDFFYRDGDLFWGHFIQVTMNAEDQFIDSDIPG